MDTESFSLLTLLMENPQLIELGLFILLAIWLLVVSQAGQTLNRQRWESDLAAKGSEIRALQSSLSDKDQEIEVFKQNADLRLSAKDAELEKFQSILSSKEEELKSWRDRLEIESGMYKDIIAAKDEKFELQQTMFRSLEERYTKEMQRFQERYDAMVNQKAEAIESGVVDTLE